MKKQVVIVGAGMAGSYAAYLASKNGYKVTVYEATNSEKWLSDPLRGRKCGEGIWQAKLEKAGIYTDIHNLPIWVDNYTENLVLGRIDSQKTYEPVSHQVKPYLFINRKTFQDYYIQAAISAGVNIIYGTKVNDLEKLKKDHSDCIVLVACGASWGFGQEGDKHEKFALAYQHTINDKKNVVRNEKAIYLSDDPLVRYYYVYPKFDSEEPEVNVGVMFNSYSIANPQDTLDNFISSILQLNRALEVNDKRTFGKLIPVKPGNVLGLDQNTLLLGDALPLADPVSGGGIGHALISAKYAVQAIESENPKSSYAKQMEPMMETLNQGFYISKKLFPLDQSEKVKTNDLVFENAAKVWNNEEIFSLSKIANNIFNKRLSQELTSSRSPGGS